MRKIYSAVLFITLANFAIAQKSEPVTLKKVPVETVKYQGGTNTCWSFSTTSLIETGVIQNDKKDIDLSELFTARNLYIEKAKRYILSNGTTLFEAGGLSHDALYGIQKYGAIPNEFYSREKGVKFSDSSPIQLDQVLKSYLDSVLKTKPIDPNWLAGFIKKHDDIAGTPPEHFTWQGKEYTPLTFEQEVLKFNPDDYVTITSFTHHPFYQNFALEIPDNFLMAEKYLNVPLNELIDIAKSTVEKGYSLVVDMDVSNNGWNCGQSSYALFEKDRFSNVNNPDTTEMAYSPQLRQQLFETLETQDDHLIHVAGIAKSKNGKLFFILKDSMGKNYGRYNGFDYVSESYFAINTISITVPKKALDQKYLTLSVDSKPGRNL
ncbi:bleomycin hydrolase [Mucilaginibacter frigoritolerans]|uniref:Bleomycin hydrolase n=1 Tax=Mucilaginibacter frigoritolerans TaxID=652788 RepID=A0A562TX20_9SPHI|nr:C1 family peptidase [Mucilaginibacter frigoritolerans]TWI97656.1 bleomycin hydrolase [Mucilaginibacter frigoritolerans]